MPSMGERVIPLTDWRRAIPVVRPAKPFMPEGLISDALGRPLRDLRISVTDRCNFRCSYCMPKEVFDNRYRFLPHAELLSFEEITRLARLFARLGARKIRLTGGEPLMRKHLEDLIQMLAALRTPDDQPLDLTLTTNGSMLARKAAELKAAGLTRLTVSLDALDDAIFQKMNDVGFPVADVLAGIDRALEVGLGPVKVNMVVKRGVNDDQVLPMARFFRDHYGSAASLRFIEFMDVGATNGWRLDDVLPSAELLHRLQREWPLVPRGPSASGETAERWTYADGRGEIGLISSVTKAFCSDCNRARLSTEGQLFLCLFGSRGHDLRSLLRTGASDDDILGTIAHIWAARDDRYSELRGSATAQAGSGERRVEMHYIGG
jgi:GTP 3',8-cyclase